jgi:hypothetical protein
MSESKMETAGRRPEAGSRRPETADRKPEEKQWLFPFPLFSLSVSGLRSAVCIFIEVNHV